MELSRTKAGKLKTTKTKLSPPDYVFVDVSVYTNQRISKTLISDIVVFLSERHTLGKSKNRKMLLSILYSIRHLALQALLLRRGDLNTETKSEENSNFHQLLKLWAQENPKLIEWLRKDPEKYTSPEIQNELLEEMALGMIRQIMSANIQNAMFITIMADETVDISNKDSAVARGGARGGRAPPVFFLKGKNRPV